MARVDLKFNQFSTRYRSTLYISAFENYFFTSANCLYQRKDINETSFHLTVDKIFTLERGGGGGERG